MSRAYLSRAAGSVSGAGETPACPRSRALDWRRRGALAAPLMQLPLAAVCVAPETRFHTRDSVLFRVFRACEYRRICAIAAVGAC